MVTLQEQASLRHLNSFGIDVRARYFAEVTTKGELQSLIATPVFKNHRRLVLGGGSNILFTRDFDGLVIHNRLLGTRVIEETDAEVVVEVSSGEPWHTFVMHCIDQGWGGIENLSLIPGTTGAAPIQNIGAYGVEIKSVLEWVDTIDLATGSSRRLSNDDCQFGYRDSIFKHSLREFIFISSITLRLTRKNHRLDTRYGAITEVLEQRKIKSPTIRDIRDAVIFIRRSKLPDPAVIGNAGSFFKNPTVPIAKADSLRERYPKMPIYPADNQTVKIPAGWLIEQTGWKGKKVGNAGVHEHQALVLVNFGGASGQEILSLSEKILASVSEKFGINLMTEVNIV